MRMASLQQRFNLARFFTGDTPRPAPYTLTRRNVYILPTGQGLFFVATLVVLLLGAINYDNSLAYLLTFLLGSSALVAMVHTYRNLLHLRVRTAAVPPAFASSELTLPVIIDNTPGPSRFNIAVRFAGQAAQRIDVAAGSHARVSIRRPVTQRGYQPLGRFVLSTRFPLGLFRAWSHVNLQEYALVYPAPAQQQQLPVASRYMASEYGDQGVGGDDFAGLRPFRSGDSLKHVNWKALAREQGLLTKQFGGDRSEQLWLDWRMLEGYDAEQRLSQLCRWIIEAQRLGMEYGLWLPDQQIPPAHNEQHYHQCLEALALYGTY